MRTCDYVVVRYNPGMFLDHGSRPQRHACPKCSRPHVVFRSRRRWWEAPWLKLFGLLPYRCAACRVRFYRKPAPEQMPAARSAYRAKAS